MPDRNEWTPLERQVSAELNLMSAQGPPGCLEPEQLLDLIESPEGQPLDAARMAHIATCAACRHAYFELQNAWRVTADLRRENRAASVGLTSAASTPQVFTPDAPVDSNRPDLFARFRRRLFAPAVGFALGAAAVYLLFLRTSPVGPTLPDKKLAALKRDLDARDRQIAQLKQEQSESRQQAQTAQVRAAELANQLQEKAHVLNDLPKRIEIARLDREDYRQAAQLLAANPLDRAEAGSNTTVRGSDSSESTPHEIELITPRRFAVRGGRPTLECRPLAGVTHYDLDIEPEDPRYRGEIPDTEPVTGSITKWRLKTSLRPDPIKDKIYLWSIRAMRSDKEVTSQSAQFVVLSQAKQRELDRAAKKYGGQPLARGIFYWQAGLLDDAERQFKAALNDTEKRPLAAALLKQLRVGARD